MATTDAWQLPPVGGETADKAHGFAAAVPIQCASTDRTVDVGIVIRAEIDAARVDGVGPGSRIAAVAHAAAKFVIPKLSRQAAWKLYGMDLVHIPGAWQLADAVESKLAIEAELTEAVAEQLWAGTQRQPDVRAAFERCRYYLKFGIQAGIQDREKTIRAAHFIAQCVTRAIAPPRALWHPSMGPKFFAEMETLARRVNIADPAYRVLVANAETALEMLSPPVFWAEFPPKPAGIDDI